MTSTTDRLPLGIRLIDAGMKRNPSFSVEHLDEERLARVQSTVIPDAGVGALVAAVFLGRRARGVAISTTTYDASHGAVPLRIYTPAGAAAGGSRPVVVNFHGGGFTLGSARQGDWLCSLVARDAGAVVVSVDYRLAPTHRFPAAVDDCYGALRWTIDHATEIGGDPGRIGVMGDSAGGNLAAVTALMARDDGFRLAHQALLYPATDMTDAVRSTASYVSNTRGIVLSNADLEVFHGHYVGEGPDSADDTDWRLSPVLAPDLSGLPPAVVVVAGLDPLHDSGVAYAAALNRAGGHAVVEDFHLMPHGFLAFPYFAAGARPAVRAVVASMREAFERVDEPAR